MIKARYHGYNKRLIRTIWKGLRFNVFQKTINRAPLYWRKGAGCERYSTFQAFHLIGRLPRLCFCLFDGTQKSRQAGQHEQNQQA